jgi:hypothetical protein
MQHSTETLCLHAGHGSFRHWQMLPDLAPGTGTTKNTPSGSEASRTGFQSKPWRVQEAVAEGEPGSSLFGGDPRRAGRPSVPSPHPQCHSLPLQHRVAFPSWLCHGPIGGPEQASPFPGLSFPLWKVRALNHGGCKLAAPRPDLALGCICFSICRAIFF